MVAALEHLQKTQGRCSYQFDRQVLGYASYNHFFPGDFIPATGPARGSDYVYAALQFTY
jgi:hypothetical protein